MASEISNQIKSRVYEHLYMKERKPEDFAKGRRNEVNIYGTQVVSVERNIQDLI